MDRFPRTKGTRLVRLRDIVLDAFRRRRVIATVSLSQPTKVPFYPMAWQVRFALHPSNADILATIIYLIRGILSETPLRVTLRGRINCIVFGARRKFRR